MKAFRDYSETVSEITFGIVGYIVVAHVFIGMVTIDEAIWHLRLAVDNVSLAPSFSTQIIFRMFGAAIGGTLLIAKASSVLIPKVRGARGRELALHAAAMATSTVSIAMIALVSTLVSSALMAVVKHGYSLDEFVSLALQGLAIQDLVYFVSKFLLFSLIIFAFVVLSARQGRGEAERRSADRLAGSYLLCAYLCCLVADPLFTFTFYGAV